MEAWRTVIKGLELEMCVRGTAGGQENSEQNTCSVLLCSDQSTK